MTQSIVTVTRRGVTVESEWSRFAMWGGWAAAVSLVCVDTLRQPTGSGGYAKWGVLVGVMAAAVTQHVTTTRTARHAAEQSHLEQLAGTVIPFEPK